MKGIIFTELCEMMENEFGIETLNDVLEHSDLPSKGIYSAVGTYDSSELTEIIFRLSEISSIPQDDLVYSYGKYFFSVLSTRYKVFFENKDLFGFLKSIDEHIHVEVRKLYPDAELPSFSYREEKDELILVYSSERSLHKFAQGLIEKTIIFYKEKATLEYKVLKADGSKVEFVIRKV